VKNLSSDYTPQGLLLLLCANCQNSKQDPAEFTGSNSNAIESLLLSYS
jgi:hypothetical protein